MAEKKEFLKGRRSVTFVDLFAGAGGISEGFLQAYSNDKYFDFILASDINANCELTHKVRYNHQLGLSTEFLTEDIMSETFLTHLLEKLKGKEVDVVTGGPSCQSFSLSGRRKRFDKRDNLFYNYLNVIRVLKPKYFVMENVKGLLTKDKGHFKSQILKEMRSIIDLKEMPIFYVYVSSMLKRVLSPFLSSAFLYKLQIEVAESESEADKVKEQFFTLLEGQFKLVTRAIPYNISKSNHHIGTIRHGLSLLRRAAERAKITSQIIEEKTVSNIDNDAFVSRINDFIEAFSDDNITSTILHSFERVDELKKAEDKNVSDLKKAIILYSLSLDECLEDIQKFSKEDNSEDECKKLLELIRLYRIEQMILHSADYGVPQNRERVVFIGCRKDQKTITSVPATVSPQNRVCLYEAINDLDFIGNGETCTKYKSVKPHPELDKLIKLRQIDGEPDGKDGKTFADWSRMGRLSHRFIFECKPFYVANADDLISLRIESIELFNHQTSNQSKDVKERLRIIAECGGYTDECKAILKEKGLDSQKRNYTVLNPSGQSPTVVTMPDDFIHYLDYRALTVREMARLQSFDDSFVFQGKRQTGGEKRKSEIPQYSLVGNAVPPLMSRAIGNAILNNIE